MTKRLLAAVAAVCVIAVHTAHPRAQKDDNETKRVRAAAAVFDEIMAAEDKAIPAAILGKAAA